MPRVFAVAAALLGPFIFGIALGFTSPCLAPMAAEVGLTTFERSAFASIINLGAVCSGLFGMQYVERLGRKPCLLITGALYAGGFGAIATCVSLPALLAGRFMTGLAAGLATVVTPCYIAEIAPASMRGTLGSLYQLFCTLGILAAYGLGEAMSWRELAALTSLLSMAAAVVCQAVLPETAAWLKMAGRAEEARGWQARLGLPVDDDGAAGTRALDGAAAVAGQGWVQGRWV
jgi:MFS family permease